MSVQYKAVSSIPPLYIVLYCLTPPEFRRYSSLNLCLPHPAGAEHADGARYASIVVAKRGIRVVNSKATAVSGSETPASRTKCQREMGHPDGLLLPTGHWQLTTGSRPLELM